MTFSIILPLPPAGCSPNVASHRHWTVRRAATEQARKDAQILGKQAMPKGWKQVPIRIKTEWFMGEAPGENALKLYWKVNGKKSQPYVCRPRDIQNALGCLKASIDGLVDAGIVPDDSHKWVQWGDCVLHRSKKEHKGRSCVVVTVETQ